MRLLPQICKLPTKPDFESYEQLVAFINLQNDIWMRAARRMSVPFLLQMLAITGEGVAAWIDALDMNSEGAPVDWAGDGPAPQWLEVAREYTEYWVHHQHICDAADVYSLKQREYVLPVVSAFVRALPRAYQRINSPLETLVKLDVTGEGASTWYLLRERTGWKLYSHTNLEPAVTVTVDDETLWRLFTNGISRRDAERAIEIDGSTALAQPFMATTAILA
ncbi:MAG: SCP2 sterol-binding domain-containing protein [Chloroflexota bacterium]